MAFLLQPISKSNRVLGLVACGIGAKGGIAILIWAKQKSNLQMLCVEWNAFSAQIRQEFRLFALENPSFCFIYSPLRDRQIAQSGSRESSAGMEVCCSFDLITL